MNEFTEIGLCDFVAREAALLDEGQFDDWLNLFAEDGRYWVPLMGRFQQDPHTYNSIAFEDRLLLQLRVDRLKDMRAHSQHPPSRCQHVLQNSRVERIDLDEGSATLRTPFLYIEARGEEQLMLAGSYHHVLLRTPEGPRIQLKRVDLLGAERALPAVQLFI